MPITREMQFVRMEDIGAFAEARALVRLSKEVAGAAPLGADLSLFEELSLCAATLAALVAEGLRSRAPSDEVLHLREAKLVLAELRAHNWLAHVEGYISSPMFDEIMRTSARCRVELAAAELSARRRGVARVEQR